MITPIAFLREAVKAVPAIKYALGVGGIVATIAIVYSFKLDPRIAFFGTVVMLLLMGVLVVFARMSALPEARLALPAVVFTWFVLLIFMALSAALFSSVFFKKPLDLAYWVTGSDPGPKPVPGSAPGPAAKDDKLSADQKYELIKLSQNGCYFFVPGEAVVASVTDYMVLAQKEFAESLRSSEASMVVRGYLETGYTDTYAMRLSERRAAAIKALLVARYGIDARRIITEGHGMKHNQKWVREYFCGAQVERR